MSENKLLKVYVVDPSLFSLPYDLFFCNALAEKGVEVTLFGRPIRDKETILEESFTFKTFFYRFSSRFESKIFKAVEHIFNMFCFVFYCILKKPDVIHFQWCPVPLVDTVFIRLLRRLSAKPVFFTAHNSTPFHGEATSKLQTYGWGGLVRSFTRVQVHNDITAARLALFCADSCEKNYIFKAHHGPLANTTFDAVILDNKIYDFCMFGNFKRYKGLIYLLKALLDLSNRNMKFKALIVGSGYVGDEESKIISKLVELKLLDFKNVFVAEAELFNLICSSKYTVFPYLEIDGSGALALSLSLGVLPVVSRLDGLLDLLSDSDAISFEPGSVESLIEKLEYCLQSDDFCKKNLLARDLFLKKFSWEAASNVVVDNYNKEIEF